jgi:hypothetical protein
MPSAAAETTRKPREGKNVLPIMTFLLLDVLMRSGSHLVTVGARFGPGLAARCEMLEIAAILSGLA